MARFGFCFEFKIFSHRDNIPLQSLVVGEEPKHVVLRGCAIWSQSRLGIPHHLAPYISQANLRCSLGYARLDAIGGSHYWLLWHVLRRIRDRSTQKMVRSTIWPFDTNRDNARWLRMCLIHCTHIKIGRASCRE